MATKRPDRSRCVYCHSCTSITRDHIPPRGFIEDPIPHGTNLITVPCCETCRRRDEFNDELMRAVFTGIEQTESQDYVVKHLIHRRDKSLQNRRVAEELEKLHVKVLRETDGSLLMPDIAFDFNHPRVRQFLERIGRGLLFDAHEMPYFAANFGFVLNPPIPESIRLSGTTHFPNRKILGAVRYTVGKPDRKGVIFIIVQFFGSIEFLLRFEILPKT